MAGIYNSSHWRTKDGRNYFIPDMGNDHLLNAIMYLERKFGKDQVEMWPVYRNLENEADKRGIHGSRDWDD